MVEAKTTFRGLRGVAAAAGALLALAGCAGTNVGSEWQCPMVRGKACVSIAGADPAVAKPAAGSMTIRMPLHESHAAAAPATARSAATAGASKDGKDCRGTCNPFAWLARLFGVQEAATEDALSDAVPDAVPDESVPEAERDIEAAPVSAVPAVPAPGDDDLRTGEVVGRIWIAPFVDAAGVYREAGWARVVIAPAGWRLP